ncbi:MAG: hypothetical protein O3A00_20460 [Planctomycetota bacterium]|nr:hypothetical protein [Planctomycetota bacterium]
MLIGVSALLLGRAHYVMHVLRRRTCSSAIVTWIVTVLVLGFWIWKFAGLGAT